MKKVFQYWSIAGVLRRGGFMSRISLCLCLLSIPVAKKLFGNRPRKVELTYRGKEFNFFVRDSADIAVLREVFVEGEYAVNVSPEPHNILDLGSHIGGSVIFFRLKFPTAKITAYEPDRKNYDLLVMNTSQFQNIECINAGVASQSGRAGLENREGSSISGRIVSGDEIDVLGIDEVLKKAGGRVGLMKFDVEGAEYRIFAACNYIQAIDVLVGELHLDLIPGKTKEDFCSIFKGFEITETGLKKDRYIMTMRKL